MEKTCERGISKEGSKCWLQQKVDEDPNFIEKQMNSPFFKLVESFPKGTEMYFYDDDKKIKITYPDGKETIIDTTDKTITRTK